MTFGHVPVTDVMLVPAVMDGVAVPVPPFDTGRMPPTFDAPRLTVVLTRTPDAFVATRALVRESIPKVSGEPTVAAV